MPASGSILGNAVLRVEDPAVLRGEARYFDDLVSPEAAHVVFVRSTVAHATIESVDTSEAESMPGVLGVSTSANLELPPVQGFMMLPPEFSRPPLAVGTVRFVGDIVAAVVAETRAQAVDAAEMVIVDYDPLPAVVDPEAALEEGSTILFPEHGSNLAIEFDFGDDPTVLDEAEVVVEGRFVNQRVAAVPMESNGVLVELDPETDGVTAWIPTQAPFGVRDSLAEAIGLPPEKVRVVAPMVGGGFGAKVGLYPEYSVAARLALDLGRAVKWTETRSENMVAMTQGRAQVQYVEMGLKRDGTITGLRVRDRRRRRRVSGGRLVPSVPHPLDVARRVQDPQDPVQLEVGHDEHDDHRGVPRCGAARGDRHARADHRHGRVGAGHRSGARSVCRTSFLRKTSRSPPSPVRTTTSVSTRRLSRRQRASRATRICAPISRRVANGAT